MTLCASLRALGCILVVVCAVLTTSAALDPSEVVVLRRIITAFPQLSLVQQDVNLYVDMNGPSKSWPNDLSTVCSGSDGYDVHGIFCSAGHVQGIYLYVAFCLLSPFHFDASWTCLTEFLRNILLVLMHGAIAVTLMSAMFRVFPISSSCTNSSISRAPLRMDIPPSLKYPMLKPVEADKTDCSYDLPFPPQRCNPRLCHF